MKRIASKTLAVFLAFITVAALVPMMLSVSAAWSGGRSEKFAAGTGSEADPYLITSAEDLAYLAYTVNTGNLYAGTYFQLTGDIDLSGKNWDPIGNYVSNIEIFKGIFDGAGHTISGLSCDITTSYAGLFGRIESSVIKNLNVKGPLVKGIKWTGGIVGYALNSSEIINCSTAIDLVQGFVVGGIVGRIQHLGESLEYNKITG
jgi:hypothetical protein